MPVTKPRNKMLLATGAMIVWVTMLPPTLDTKPIGSVADAVNAAATVATVDVTMVGSAAVKYTRHWPKGAYATALGAGRVRA